MITASAFMRGINIYGLETESRNFVCSWVHPIDYYVKELYDLGFNQLRIPFSIEYVREGNWEHLDRLFSSLQVYPEMNITLDAHRIYPTHQAYDPTEGIALDQFIHYWTVILDRYLDNPHLTEVDIFNEYQGTDVGYWNGVSEKIVTALENRYPGRFIFNVGGTRWGGSLNGISLEHLPFADRIRYTLHKYIFSTIGDWEQNWNDAIGAYPQKVNIGEFGFKEKNDEMYWAKTFLAYLKQRGIRDSMFWTLAYSSDTDGLFLDSDCTTILWNKYNILKEYWSDNDTVKTQRKLLRGSS
jgi:hypothetical protein